MNLGKRLVYLRQKLKLSQKDVSDATGIPQTTYRNMEYGVTTYQYKYFLDLCTYFDKLWQEKFREMRNYPINPEIHGQQIEEITVNWLLYGADYVLQRSNEFLRQSLEDFRFRENMAIDEVIGLKEHLRCPIKLMQLAKDLVTKLEEKENNTWNNLTITNLNCAIAALKKKEEERGFE